jgi:isocitrate lyase
MTDKNRWDGIIRPYSEHDILKLRGPETCRVEHSFAKRGAKKLWDILNEEGYVNALGALSGSQAVQMAKAGLRAIYLSGWQVAADANLSGDTYPDQSLYPANSVPSLVERINKALQRNIQIEWAENSGTDKNPGYEKHYDDLFIPIIADAEAGFGGLLNSYELMKNMIRSGASGVHFEDQVASEKKCGHLSGKTLVSTSRFINVLSAARLAADVEGVETVLFARTDANSAQFVISDIDERDKEFIIDGERTPEGYYKIRGGLDCAIARGLAYAPYADVLWCETSTPDLDEAKKFAEAIYEKYPNKILSYNCSPSFNWKKHLDSDTIAKFQRELGAMGYKFQFVTLAGYHALNVSMYELASEYRDRGMSAYVDLQEKEFEFAKDKYTSVKHQREVGTGYFDEVQKIITGGKSSTLAMTESTETEQF